MDWQTRRKLIYALTTLLTVSAISIYILRDTIFPAPTCFDTKQNGYEVGVDCGGVCSLRCSSEVVPLEVIWARAIKISNTKYDVVAMVSNKNINNASHSISYTFVFYDIKGLLIGEIKGTTIAPVDGDFPIIRQSISIPRVPYKVMLQIEDTPHYTVYEKPTSPTLRIANERYEVDSISRVYASVMNTKRKTINNLPVRVVLFDKDDNAYAVGETIIPRLDKEEIKDISFTWDTQLPYPPVRIRVYPIFDPFLAIE